MRIRFRLRMSMPHEKLKGTSNLQMMKGCVGIRDRFKFRNVIVNKSAAPKQFMSEFISIRTVVSVKWLTSRCGAGHCCSSNCTSSIWLTNLRLHYPGVINSTIDQLRRLSFFDLDLKLLLLTTIPGSGSDTLSLKFNPGLRLNMNKTNDL